MKRVAPVGLVNTQLAGLTNDPHVAALQGGGYVVVWGLNDSNLIASIELQRFDNNGQPLGSEVTIDRASQSSADVAATDLVALSGGDFLIGSSARPFGADESVSILRYHPGGTQAAVVPVGDSHNIVIALAASKTTGGYAAAWQHAPGANQSVEAQIFDASNNQVTGVIPVSSGHTGHASHPALDWLTNGNLLVAYANDDTAHINAWIFNPSGDRRRFAAFPTYSAV